MINRKRLLLAVVVCGFLITAWLTTLWERIPELTPAISLRYPPTRQEACRPKNHFVFVKVHKCSSSTIASVLRTYSVRNNLTMALPQGPILINWPYGVVPEAVYRYPEIEEYGVPLDVVFHHHRFNVTTWKSLMPMDAVYLAATREPLDQLRSAIGFLGLIRKKGDTPLDRAEYTLTHPEDEKVNTSRWLHNFQAFSLGFPTERSGDAEFVKTFIKSLDEIFDLVLVSEYLTESLLLLRRRMCWQMRDVIFLSVNVKVDTKSKYPKELYARSRIWNNVDNLLYDHFKQKLFLGIAEEDNFQEELKRFRVVCELVRIFCEDLESTNDFVAVPGSKWNEDFKMTREDCLKLQASNMKSSKMLHGIMNNVIDAYARR